MSKKFHYSSDYIITHIYYVNVMKNIVVHSIFINFTWVGNYGLGLVHILLYITNIFIRFIQFE